MSKPVRPEYCVMSTNWTSTTGPATGPDFPLPRRAHPRRVPRPRRGAGGPRSRHDPDPLPAPCVSGRRLRGSALLLGLIGYGFSMAVMVRAGLGLDPWDVFHQGLSLQHGHDHRHRIRRRRRRGAARLDTAAQQARRRHHRQRRRHRRHGRHRPCGAADTDVAANSRRDDGGRCRPQRDQHGALHRCRPRSRPARRADDRPRRAHRAVGAAGPHVDRGDRAGGRLAARRHRRRRHLRVRARDRSAGSVLRRASPRSRCWRAAAGPSCPPRAIWARKVALGAGKRAEIA